jgi:hypothetical protein
VRADRSIEERVALAMPVAIVRGAMRACLRLTPGSPIRRRIFKRTFALGLEGSARGDHAFALLFYEPDVDLRVVGEVAPALGLAERYAGHTGYVQAWRDYTRDMGSLRVVPEELIDLGERVALRAKLVGVGRSSGVETARTLGYVCYLSARGLIARQEGYWEWDQALASLAGRASSAPIGD